MRASDGSIAAVDGGWAKNFGGAGGIGTGIAVDNSSVYITGYFSGGNFTTPALTRKGSKDAFVFKLAASDGGVTWAQGYGGPPTPTTPPYTPPAGNIAGYGIAVDSGGDIYMSGTLAQSTNQTPPLARIAGAGSADAVVLKLAGTDGSVIWAKNFGGSASWTHGAGIALDASGNPYLGGFMTGNLTTPPLTKIGTRDVFVLKMRVS